jgi:hypothetical protein
MPCSVEGGEELGRSGRRRCGQPWEEKRRREVGGETDEWDRGVGDWERGREGERKVGRREWVGPETAVGPRKRKKRKKRGEVGRGKLGSNRKGRERFWRFGFLLSFLFFLFSTYINQTNPTKIMQHTYIFD